MIVLSLTLTHPGESVGSHVLYRTQRKWAYSKPVRRRESRCSFSITVMKWGVSCGSHAKNNQAYPSRIDDPCAYIVIPSYRWRYEQLHSKQCICAARWRQTVPADIFFGSFSRIRNDSSQGIWPNRARTGYQTDCHHQAWVAWWKNRREKDRWDDERTVFTILR